MPITKQEAISQMIWGFHDRDPRNLRRLNDRCIEQLALNFEKDFYNLAILAYALSKMSQKPRYWGNTKVTEYIKQIESNLKLAQQLLQQNKPSDFSSLLLGTVSIIDKIESADRRYVRQPIEKAKLKIAATLYAQGFSLGSASEITGLDKREILGYAGRTMMFDRVKPNLSVSDRLASVRKIFGK